MTCKMANPAINPTLRDKAAQRGLSPRYAPDPLRTREVTEND